MGWGPLQQETTLQPMKAIATRFFSMTPNDFSDPHVLSDRSVKFIHSSRQPVFTECLLCAWLTGKTSMNETNMAPALPELNCLVKRLTLNKPPHK